MGKKNPQMIKKFLLYYNNHNLEGFAFLIPIDQLHVQLLFVVSTLDKQQDFCQGLR